MEPDWDLHAVVRGFASINSTATLATVDDHVDMKADEGEQKKKHQGLFCSKNLADELHELFTPYLLNPHPHTASVQPTISTYCAALEASKRTKTHQQLHKGNHVLGGTFSANSVPVAVTTASATQTSHKPKRRKFQLKKISLVPAAALSSDVWAWRKYGQKPIKGSPYPRGYYKCSSSKTCLARKQVERNRSDPKMFIVTCTGEHNHDAPTHKNSLAGTTRHPNPLFSTSHDESILPTSKLFSSSSMANISPAGSVDDEVLQHNNGMESNPDNTKGDMTRNSNSNLVSDVLGLLDIDVMDDFFDDLDEIAIVPMDGF